jgi:UDP-3-O-[3-hydroxymyristoyl] N-acetylglucosamine deacetylase
MPPIHPRCVQRTLHEPVTYCGPAAGGQRRATVAIRPAAPDTGVRFVRCDALGGPRTLPARVEYLGTDGACVTLECPSGIGICRVGPLLAALTACGIDNAEVTVDGAEAVLPDDGPAALVEALCRAGAAEQARPLRVIRIERVIDVTDGTRRAMLRPSNIPHAAISLDAADAHHWLAVGLGEEPLRRELVGYRAERSGRPTGSEAMRQSLLECVGFLAAAGAPIVGHFLAQNPDHELMRRLVRTLAAQQGSWSLVEAAALGLGDRTPVAPS